MIESSTMARPSHAGLRHLALNVRDLAAMKQFYVELMGFAVEWEPDADNVYLSSGIDNLALHRAPGESRSAPGESSARLQPSAAAVDSSASRQPSDASPSNVLDHLGVIVRTADDVDQWAAFLESKGIVIDAKPRTHRDGARS